MVDGISVVGHALSLYPVRARIADPIRGRFNALYRVHASEGEFLFRLHPPDNGDVESTAARLASEMLWLGALGRDTDLVVPVPCELRDGSLVGRVVDRDGSVRCCVMLGWVEGRFVDRSIGPPHLRLVGRMTARLHDHAERFAPPSGFTRGNSDGLDDDAGVARLAPLRSDAAEAAELVGRHFAEGYGRDAGRLAARAIVTIWDTLAELGMGSDVFGLIHSDIHQGNYLFHRREPRLIDFNRSGYAHYLYDLACTLVNLHGRAGYDAMKDALLRGYREGRRLPSEHERYLAALIALRGGLEHAHWPLLQRDDPRFRAIWREEVEKGLGFLERFLGA
jgi:Ser/Thr protein kinase RdoA (MazF antagonist)